MIEDLEEYDKKGEWWLYFDRADDMDVEAKNCYADGMISKDMWNLLRQKYIAHANDISTLEGLG